MASPYTACRWWQRRRPGRQPAGALLSHEAMRLFERDFLSDRDWHIFQLVQLLAFFALAGGIALVVKADLASVRGIMLGVAGIGFILLSVIGVASFLRGDWDRDD